VWAGALAKMRDGWRNAAGTCWVCDEFRFIYIRIGKTGSTTMTASYLAGVSEMVGGSKRFEVNPNATLP